MSTSIRPPTGSPGGAAGVEQAEGASVADVAAAGEARSTAAASEAARGQSTAGAEASGSASGAWLHKLAAGEVTRAEAVEGLIAEALEAHGGARLAPQQRSELEGLLRSALLEDPVLGQLLGGE